MGAGGNDCFNIKEKENKKMKMNRKIIIFSKVVKMIIIIMILRKMKIVILLK